MKRKRQDPGDPELERRLDAAYGSLRPRPDFEEELWNRLRGRRPHWQRLTGWAASLGLSGPAPALAGVAVLVVLVGVFFFARAHPFGGGGGAAVSYQGAGAGPSVDRPVGSFGKLPVATLNPAQAGKVRTPQPSGSPVASATPAAPLPYFGPAELSWNGVLPNLQAFVPVYRYTEPGSQDTDAFVAAHRSRGVTLRVRGSDRQAGREPLFALTVTPPPAGGSTSPDPAQAAAQQFLAAHSLTPTWTFHITVDVSSNLPALVRYERFFEVPGFASAPQIDAGGQRAGLDVSVSGGQVAEVVGPLPLQLPRASYPGRSADSVLRAALSQPAAGGPTLGSVPHVVLTHAQLVYIAVPTGGYGVFEPAFLFTGSFQVGGQTYEKRVLVVAIDESELGG